MTWFPILLLGMLVTWLIMRREVNYWKREAEDQRLNNDLLCGLHRESIEEIAGLEDHIDDLQRVHAEHLSRCSVLPDDTLIIEDEEVEI